MSDGTLGDLTNCTDMHNQHLKRNSGFGFKEDNAKEILKAKLDIRNQSQSESSRPPQDKNESFEKENTQIKRDKDDRSAKLSDNESFDASSQSKRVSKNDEDGPIGGLAERRMNIKYTNDEDSPEENEEEDEKENAMNKLKALLGNSRPKSDPSSVSQQQTKNAPLNDKSSSDFLHIIDRMKKDLFHQLYITNPDNTDENEEADVSRIFYDGRDGQQHTVEVLQKFFKSLTTKTKQFIHHYESSAESLQLQHQPRSQGAEDSKLDEDEQSDKERIRKKLSESKKQVPKQTHSSKEGLKSLLSKPKAPK